MPKRTNEFQKIVLGIYSALAETNTKVEESILLQEKNSDSEREIDVLVTTLVTGHPVRVAIECRDHRKNQDITWVDSLIGKYSNLDIQKVVAISHTKYSKTAKQKAAQHSIELLTLQEATEANWAKKVGPTAFQFFGFRNRPMFLGLQLNGQEQLKIEYTFKGEFKSANKEDTVIAQIFLDVWEAHASHIATQKISQYVFSNWDRISGAANTLRYCEITERYTEHHILNTPFR